MIAREIHHYMSVVTQRIGPDRSLVDAHRQMRENRVRHLPVIDAGQHLVGILSLGDLHLMETLKGVEPETTRVEEAMTPSPYRVEPDTPLAQVARTMAENKYGAALVVNGGEVIGVFTTNDALNVLASVLEGQVVVP